MKKLFVFASLAFVLLLSGCSALKMPYMSRATVLDYSEYTNKGFFLSEANSVNFEYKALGSITAVTDGGYVVVSTKERKDMKDDVYTSSKPSAKIKYGPYKSASPADALSTLCDKAMEIGANGVINININYIPATYDPKTRAILTPDSFVISGMAIRK